MEVGWVLGVSFAVGANIISNLGVNIQKQAHDRRTQVKKAAEQSNSPSREKGDTNSPMSRSSSESSDSPMEMDVDVTRTEIAAASNITTDDTVKQGSYCFDSRWLLGMLCQIIGALLDFAALGFAPQSVVAPLGSLTLVVNVCLAPLMHAETVSRRTMIATATIIVGCAVTVVFSAKDEPLNKLSEVYNVYKSTQFLIYMLTVGPYMAAAWFTQRYYSRKYRYTPELYDQKDTKVHLFALTSLAGTMGAQNLLFAKSTSTMVVLSTQGRGLLFVHWETYCILACLVLSISLQLRWLNSSLKRFSAQMVVPVFQSFWISVSVIAGLAVYDEFSEMKQTAQAIFPCGVLITVVGVGVLTAQHTEMDEEDSSDSAFQVDLAAEDNRQLGISGPRLSGAIDPDEVRPGLATSHSNSSKGGRSYLLRNDSDMENELTISAPWSMSRRRGSLSRQNSTTFDAILPTLRELAEASVISPVNLGKLLTDPDKFVLKHSDWGLEKEDFQLVTADMDDDSDDDGITPGLLQRPHSFGSSQPRRLSATAERKSRLSRANSVGAPERLYYPSISNTSMGGVYARMAEDDESTPKNSQTPLL